MAERELWAVLDSDGCVMWTRGGSSTAKRLMVYPSQVSAERVLKGPWIKQVMHREDVEIRLVYKAKEE